jgi:hypothetical protein
MGFSIGTGRKSAESNPPLVWLLILNQKASIRREFLACDLEGIYFIIKTGWIQVEVMR